MLTNMIRLEPKDRLTVPQILAHDWLKDTNDDSDSESSNEDENENNEKGNNGNGNGD